MKQKIKQIIKKVDFTHPKNRVFLNSYYHGFFKQQNFQNIKNYCIFIGYQRSGSSLVGSLLDAHPNAVIAHELNVMQYFLAQYSRNQIYYLLLDNARKYAEQGRNWSGYTYQVPHQWQGKFQQIEIIGDKKAALSAISIANKPHLLEQIQKTVAVPLKWVHVVRNPYDNITTMFQKKDRKTKAILSFPETINYYFSLCDNIQQIKQLIPGDSCFDLRQEALIQEPKETLRQLCIFLNLEPSESYLTDCASIIFKSPKKTRQSLDWKLEDIKLVEKKMSNYDFLQGYNFSL